jgi:membrane-associated phospholipid phosphatase
MRLELRFKSRDRSKTRVKLGILSVTLLAFIVAQPARAQNNQEEPTVVAETSIDPQPQAPTAQSTDVMSREDQNQFLATGEDPENHLISPFIRHMIGDQQQFWTAPFRLNRDDARYLVPFAAFTGALFAGDKWISAQVNLSHVSTSKTVSDYLTYSLIGAAGASYIWGHITRNDHLRETGLLATEAALNSTLVAYGLKEITGRERPYQGDGTGSFFQGGSSFPSEHSAIAWSVASVVAHEYPGTLTQLGAYGIASAITITRVTAKQHFPSDVVVGSALGWYFARQIYRKRHDPELGGAGWGEFVRDDNSETPRKPEDMGSPSVPLDSWVYPAFERLIALGYVKSGHLGIRPWTRMECARLLEEAQERVVDNNNQIAERTVAALSEEFIEETARLDGAANRGIALDSVYTRVTGISGTPLADGYHFGQTLINDYGRPYWEGFNNVTGLSTHGVAGPFSFDVRGEYQHAPAVPSYPIAVQQAIANADLTSPVSNAVNQIDRFSLLEGTVGLQFNNVAISFGKQNAWLGVGESGSFLLTNNAASILMLKIETASPYRVPLLSSLLGPMRTEYFLGQLSGTVFEFNEVTNTLLGPGNINPQPFLQGTKVSFKPTDDLEIGMGFSAQFAGPGLPFTLKNFFRALYSHTSGTNDPGKRISELDASYRIPKLRNWLTAYIDSLVVDEYSPIGSDRPNVNPGIYMPRLPKLPKMQLRAEGIKESLTSEFSPGFVYYGVRRYRSGYTNDGNLMGSWIGRAGRGGQGWLTYSFSPRSMLQAGYRHQEVSDQFIGGGRAVDYSIRGEVMASHDMSLSGFLQYEQWKFPVLAPTRQSDVTASFQFTIYPHWGARK